MRRTSDEIYDMLHHVQTIFQQPYILTAASSALDLVNSPAIQTAASLMRSSSFIWIEDHFDQMNRLAELTKPVSDLWNTAPELFRPISERIPGVDLASLGRITDEVMFPTGTWDLEDWDVDAAAEAIASEYRREMEIEATEPASTVEAAPDRPSAVPKPDVKEIREWLAFLLSILSLVLSLRTGTPVVNNVQQMNHFYVMDCGLDAEALNFQNYRIVNQEIVVRVKHDCNSPVVANLPEGQMVRVVGSYRKWRQILWKDEGGENCLGWIQNYKLTEFW